MRDDRYYPEPDRFNPDRFLQTSYGGISEEDYNPLNVAFGFGRRLVNAKPSGRDDEDINDGLPNHSDYALGGSSQKPECG